MFRRISKSIRQRLLFLTAGNLLLMGVILANLLSGDDSTTASALDRFGTVLMDAGPNVAPVILAGLGLTGIIFAGALDLSIGSMMVVAGTVFGILFSRGFDPAACFLGCFLTAFVLSNFNGLLIRWLEISPIIVTLAGLTFYRGLALIMADAFIPDFGGSIAVHDDAYHGPGQRYPGQILLIAILAALAWETWGKLPRVWLAHGCSPEACRLHGLKPGLILQSTFFAGGIFLGLAALVDVTNRQNLEPARMARGFELEVIGAIVLGGTNIFGGEGSFLGTILGAFFLYFVGQTLLYADVDLYYREAIQGALIVIVIGVDCALHRRQKLLDELK